jgi:hypothetical protein
VTTSRRPGSEQLELLDAGRSLGDRFPGAGAARAGGPYLDLLEGDGAGGAVHVGDGETAVGFAAADDPRPPAVARLAPEADLLALPETELVERQRITRGGWG